MLPLFITPSQQITLRPATSVLNQTDAEQLEQTHQLIDQRLTTLDLPGWSRTTIRNQNIVVTFPNTVKNSDVIRALSNQGELAVIDTGVEFPLVDGVEKVKIGPVSDPESGTYEAILTSEDFLNAAHVEAEEGGFGLEVALTPAAAERFENFIDERRGVYLCITMDKIIMGCPIVKMGDNNRLQLLQGPTDIMVGDLVLVGQINSGTLPMRMQLVRGRS
jgi:hypothetical protein